MRPRRPPLGGSHVLMGFATLCDAAYGRPCPPHKVPTVAPTALGGVLLPFPCPHCGEVRPEMVDPAKRQAYRDPQRGHLWCPGCRGRYHLDVLGTPLPAPLGPGAACAPCRVTVGGASWILDLQSEADDLDFLEAT